MTPPRIPPTLGTTPPMRNDVPVIELSAVQLTVGKAPLDPNINAFFIGPVFLQVSFDDVHKRQLVRALTGIELPAGVENPQL